MNGEEDHPQPVYADLSNMQDDDRPILINEAMSHSPAEQNPHVQHQQGSSPLPTKGVLLEQERFLPIANVVRIMKRMVPSQGKMSKEAKELVQECVSEFISFITSEANDRCLQEKRKTVTADDLLEAMEILGFDNYIEPMRIFLRRFREVNNRSTPSIHMRHLINPSLLNVSNSSEPAMNSAMAQIPGPSVQQFVTHIPDGSRLEAPALSKPENAGVHDDSPPEVDVNELQPSGIEIMVDPSTMQHYIAQRTEEGEVQLFPISVNGNVINIQTDSLEQVEENEIEQPPHPPEMLKATTSYIIANPPPSLMPQPHQIPQPQETSLPRRQSSSHSTRENNSHQRPPPKRRSRENAQVSEQNRQNQPAPSSRPTRQAASKRPKYH